MLDRLLRWLRRHPEPAARPGPSTAPPTLAPGAADDASPYRRAAADTPTNEPRRTQWWPLRLVPPGVLERVDVYALRYMMPMIYLTANDVVFVVEGRTYLLEHEGCEPADREVAWMLPHVHRHAKRLVQERRLTQVLAVETTTVAPTMFDGTPVERSGEPAPTRSGPRVDLASALRPEIVRVLAGGDRSALASLLALLDLLARFDGHEGGECELLPEPGDTSRIHVGLGACGDEVFGERLDAGARARVLAALAEGVVDDGVGGLRVSALIDKHESLSGCSGYRSRLCLARLTTSPTGFVYEDELLWSEYERGMEYS